MNTADQQPVCCYRAQVVRQQDPPTPYLPVPFARLAGWATVIGVLAETGHPGFAAAGLFFYSALF